MRFSLRIAFLLFALASIGVGVVLNRYLRTEEYTVYRWPTLETLTERRTFFTTREISISHFDASGRRVWDARNVFCTIYAGTNGFS